MKQIITIFILQLVLFANKLQLCYVEEKYNDFNAIFGHIFLAYKNKAASFNLDSDLSFKNSLKALFKTDALMQILPKNRLISEYNSEGREVNCYDVKDVDEANIAELFSKQEIKDTYSFFGKNCAFALSSYANNYGVRLKSSIIPKRLLALNTNEKMYFSNILLYHDLDFSLTLLELNHRYDKHLSLFTISKDDFRVLKISNIKNFGYELWLGYKIKQKKAYLNAALFYKFKGLYVSYGSYGFSYGFMYNTDDFSGRIEFNKKDMQISVFKDFSAFRLNLIANKKSAKIGFTFKF